MLIIIMIQKKCLFVIILWWITFLAKKTFQKEACQHHGCDPLLIANFFLFFILHVRCRTLFTLPLILSSRLFLSCVVYLSIYVIYVFQIKRLSSPMNVHSLFCSCFFNIPINPRSLFCLFIFFLLFSTKKFTSHSFYIVRYY